MSYSKGISWIADCRIPFLQDDKFDIRRYNEYHDTFSSYENKGSADGKYVVNESNQQGRFTPNLLVCDDMLNDGVISETKANLNYKWDNTQSNSEIFKGRGKYTPRNDKGTNSRYYDLDLWFDKMVEKL